jgi:N-acetylmuramoyl-L-alanine amidase
VEIINDILVDDEGNQHYSPGNYIGPKITPKYIIMHGTATASPFSRNVDAFLIESYTASVHLLIGRAGEIHQFVPFNAEAGHCGENHWHDVYHSMDRYSIGIEMLNAQELDTINQMDYYKKTYGTTYTIPEKDRVLINKNWWQIYPKAQLDAALAVVRLLFQNYQELKDVLGHSEINPKWRVDPGPAFPMQWFHAKVIGLDENVPITRVHITTRYSRLYDGPGDDHETIGEGLPRNTPLGILSEENGWSYIHLRPDDNNPPFIKGWIQSDRIKEDDLKPRHYHMPPDILAL